MMIDVDAHKNGYGTILLRHVEEVIKENGFKIMKLETFKENIQAVNFYKKHGWMVKDKKEEESLGVTRIFFEKFVS